MSIKNKAVFLLKKPKMVLLFGQERKKAKRALLQILKKDFKIGKNLFIFEADQKEIDKFYFLIKNSKLPILGLINLDQAFSFEKIAPQAQFVLNSQDQKIKEGLASFNNFKNIKIGFGEKSDIFATDIKIDGGTNFKVNHKGSFVPYRFEEILNEKEINIILFVVSIAIILGLNLVEISQSFWSLDNDNKTG